jgi:hypothetical protein
LLVAISFADTCSVKQNIKKVITFVFIAYFILINIIVTQ